MAKHFRALILKDTWIFKDSSMQNKHYIGLVQIWGPWNSLLEPRTKKIKNCVLVINWILYWFQIIKQSNIVMQNYLYFQSILCTKNVKLTFYLNNGIISSQALRWGGARTRTGGGVHMSAATQTQRANTCPASPARLARPLSSLLMTRIWSRACFSTKWRDRKIT